MSDWFNSYLGITPTANGGIQTNSGLTLDPFVLAAQDNAATSTPALPVYPQNPFQKWFTDVLVGPGINNLHGTAGTDGKAVGTTKATGWGDVQGYLITGGAILLGVLIIVLGAWSIVKD